MVDQLFGSKTRVKLLKFFFTNQDQDFFVREITRLLDEQINSVRRELLNLADAGVVESKTKDNKVFYSLDKTGELYEGLDKIMRPQDISTVVSKKAPTSASKGSKAGSVVKNSVKKGIVVKDAKLNLVKEEISQVDGVKLIIASGVLVKDGGSNSVDLLIATSNGLSQKSMQMLKDRITEVERRLNKSLSFVVLDEESYTYRIKINDVFISTLMAKKHEVLLDDQGMVG